MEPKVRHDEVRLGANKDLSCSAVWLVKNPFQSDRRIHNQLHGSDVFVASGQRFHPFNARLVEKLLRGGRATTGGSPSEIGQAFDCLSPFQAAIAGKREAENLPMLRFRRAPVHGRPHT